MRCGISLLLLPPLLLAASCTLLEKPREPVPNRAPVVDLTSGPLDGDADAFYRVHFFWSGFDSDGQVDHYEYLLTDDETTGSLVIDANIYDALAALGYAWTATGAFDARFVVSADQFPDLDEPADSIYWQPDPLRFHAQHSFFVRAVDDEGAVSTLPAHRTFTATTFAPEASITYPADLGAPGGFDDFSSFVRFRWTGRDSLQDGSEIEPDSSRTAILPADYFPDDPIAGSLIELPDSLWGPWTGWNTGPTDSSAGGQEELLDLEALFGSPLDGQFAYFVQAKDEAGAVTSHYEDGVNLRKLRVVETLRPRLLIRSPLFGVRVVDHDQGLAFSAAADVDHVVSWSGSAEHYGSEIDGYRHGWDIVDPENDAEWSPWSADGTGSAFNYPGGAHRLDIQCRDLAGNVLAVAVEIDFIPVTLERGLLFVDDYSNLGSEDPGQGWPDGPEYSWGTFPHSDAQQKAFWDGVLADYTGYDPDLDFFRVTVVDDTVPFAILAGYRRALWEVREASPGASALHRTAGFVDAYATGWTPVDYLSVWLEAGGQLLLCGSSPIRALLPLSSEMGDAGYERKLPMDFRQDLGYSGGSEAESEAAVERFLPWRHFGIDVAAAGVDGTPKAYGWAGADWPTTRTFWGLAGIGYGGQEQSGYPVSTGWAPGDTLRLRAEVADWFAAAGGVFMGAIADAGGLDCDLIDCESPPPYFGLDHGEIYNWDFFAQAASPPPVYRPEQMLPFLAYLPADSTTRWGAAPTDEHPFLTPAGDNHDELSYSLGGGGFHAIGVIGQLDPGRPSVLLGFTPYYLEPDEARGLIGHLLTDVMGLEP